ncbi:hypothetical protein IAT38_001865 [Cryptococcus sp. DSM 104549]
MPPSMPSSSQEEEIRKLTADVPPRPFSTYDTLSYDELLHNHLIPNTPFLLSPQATSSWPLAVALRGPHLPSGASTPQLSALRKYAGQVVPVANTGKREFSEFEREERALGEVLDVWEGVGGGREGEASGGRGLYAKDWHLMAEIESEGRGVGEVYSVPECLRDDWLNPPFTPSSRPTPSPTTPTPTLTPTPTPTPSSTSTSDFRFTYLGPPLTYTPLHRDVYASYSWSANLVGRKLWWFFPPGEESLGKVRDERGELVFDVRGLDGEGGGIKVLQEEGEVMFVPSGWHHQVVNLDFCISINQNFFSSPSLPPIYSTLCTAQLRVEESIADVREMIIDRLGKEGAWEEEWVREVQGLLEMDAGWGWGGFWGTVRKNLVSPPAPPNLSPPVSMRNAFIRQVVEQYKQRREWLLLPEVREIVEEVERLIIDT